MTEQEKARISECNRARYNAEKGIDNLYKMAGSYENVDFFELGSFDLECRHCGALHFVGQKPLFSKGDFDEFYDCCNFGKQKLLLDKIDEYPNELKMLFTAENEFQKSFLTDIRKYNFFCMWFIELLSF